MAVTAFARASVTAGGAGAVVLIAGCAALAASTGSELPEHFGVAYEPDGPMVNDCRIDESSVRCEIVGDPPAGGIVSWTAQITGTLTGHTMKATKSSRITSRSAGAPTCLAEQVFSGPVSYVFSDDGTVEISDGPTEVRTSFSGTCPDDRTPSAETVPEARFSGTWTAIT